MPPRTAVLLENIRDATQYITNRTGGTSLESYRRDRDLRQVVERNFEIVGEALRRLHDHDPATAARITDARAIVDFRNVLIHAYDVIDDAKVWRIVQDAVPLLKTEVEALLQEVTRSHDV